MQLGPFQIRPKIIVLSQGAYLRMAALGWVGGFFLCRTLELRHASPHVQNTVAMAMDIVAMLLFITLFWTREPHFIDKDQAALIERFSAFLDRNHLWNRFLTEDAQGKR